MTTTDNSEVWVKAQASEDFQRHRRKYRSFAFPMAMGFLVWYFSFILLTTFARDFVSTPVFGLVNLAFILALAQFITTFLIAWLYDRYSSKNLDAPGEELKRSVESELK
jgi:Predicted membrane protein